MTALLLLSTWSDALEGVLSGADWLISQPRPLHAAGLILALLMLPLWAICRDLSASETVHRGLGA